MPSVVEPTHGPLPTELASNGCFETMRAYGGRIFRLDQHLERLLTSAQYLGIPMSASPRQLKAKLLRVLSASGLREALVRIALLPGTPSSAVPRLRSGFRPMVGQERRPWGSRVLPSIVVQRIHPPSPKAYRQGIRVAVVPTRPFSIGAITAQAKYSARLSSIMATVEAQLRGVDEALFMDPLGSVTESTASNFSMIKGGTLISPPCWLGLLQGVTRDVVAELAHALRIPWQEVPLTRHEVYGADEAFLSSTTKEILPVTTIDGRTIGTGAPGPMTKRLHRAFRQLVQREVAR